MLAKLSDLYKKMDEEEDYTTSIIKEENQLGGGGDGGGDSGGGCGGETSVLKHSRTYLLAKRMSASAKFLIDRNAVPASHDGANNRDIGEKRSRPFEIDRRLATPDELKVSQRSM